MFKKENVNASVQGFFFFFLTNHCTNYNTDSEMFGMHNNIMIQTREAHKFAYLKEILPGLRLTRSINRFDLLKVNCFINCKF